MKRTITPLIGPAAILGLFALAVFKWPVLMQRIGHVRELRALIVILPFAPYGLFSIGAIAGWRYGYGGVVFSSVVLGLAYFALMGFGPGYLEAGPFGPSIPAAAAFLLPLNLTLFALLKKRRVASAPGILIMLLLGGQLFAVLLLCPPKGASFSGLLIGLNDLAPGLAKRVSDLSLELRGFLHHGSWFKLKNISTVSALAFLLGFGLLLIRFLKSKSALAAGFLGAFSAAFLGIYSENPNPSLTLYFLAAGLIFIVGAVESSYFMAYIDELTLLAGRRGLNETLGSLKRSYAIAMIDVDLFKKFNDTWGHKTGDEVLRMIAARLMEMSGGARVFRYGGEEFTAIFSGKGAKEAAKHLEELRRTIESTPFVVRGRGRKKGKPEQRGKVKSFGGKKVKVTVSIGVAEPKKGSSKPKEVIKAADRALYRAKRAGRNRVAT